MIDVDSSHKKKSKKRKSFETGDEAPDHLHSTVASKKKKKIDPDLDGGALHSSTTQGVEALQKNKTEVVKRGHRKAADHSQDTSTQDQTNSEHGATETSHRKKKSKDKSSTDNASASILNSQIPEEDSALATKTKKKKHKRDRTQEESESNIPVNDESGAGDTTVTSHGKKKSSSKDKPSSLADGSDPVSADMKKHKKKKAKLKDESSLGVINTDILQQAEINLGLPMVDKLEKDENMVSPKADATDSNTNNSQGEESVKKKKKKKKDKSQTEVESNTPNEKSRNERAVEYLRLWGSNRGAWKFNKMMQVQLLHIMYEKTLVSDEDFENLLLYLDGMKGMGRDKTKESAKKILDEGEAGTTDADKEERARQVFQMLS